MLESLIWHYGYLAIFIGTMLEGESVLILGGFFARRGYLQLPLVILMALLGSMFSDHFCFYLGRHYGQKLLRRFPTWNPRVKKVQVWLERVHTPLILGFRFLYGFRAMTPFVLGMSPLPAKRFSYLEAAGALIWSVTFGVGGFLFGKILEAILGDVKHNEKIILLSIVVFALILWLIFVIRSRRGQSRSDSRAE